MSTSEKIKLFKMAAQITTTIGVGKVVRDIINMNTVVETTADAVKVNVGSFVIGGMVAENAHEHVNRRIDGAIAWYEGRKDVANNAANEYKSNR